ncbi:hypothetical protein OWR28_17150 [Chryseobacterium sp. 1B4]
MINDILRANNYQFEIIEPIPSQTNKILIKDADGHPWRMLNFIENSVTFLTAPSLQTAFEAAKTFSYFLNTVNNTEKLPTVEDPIPAFSILKKELQIIRAR